MSDDNTHDPKSRKPDYYMQVEMQQSNGRKKLMDVGALWEGKDGYKTGDSVYGRMVIQPRDQREALREIREDQARSQEHKPEQRH